MTTEAAALRAVQGTAARPPGELTDTLAGLMCEGGADAVPDVARECARHALLDWACVALAGMREPAVRIVARLHDPQWEPSVGLVPFTGPSAPWAVLVNGTAGHALDYDDVNSRMHGHPSVPVVPTALAASALRGCSGRQLLDAVVLGHEAEALVGEQFGGAHYANGFHATGTIGTFGAAAAAAHVLGLTDAQARHALGLAATQAAGLKCMFGTMAKPLHAGKAAMNGLWAARLAQQGFTAAADGIEGAQGFAATQCTGLREAPVVSERWAVQDTLYKYHAACYLTHSAIEALRALLARTRLAPEDVERLDVHVPPGHDSVCNIAAPATGLQVKFSLRHLMAMVAHGRDTADLDAYTDALACDADLVRWRERVQVRFEHLPSPKGARVELHARGGAVHAHYADVGVPREDLPAQWRALVAKGRAVTRGVLALGRFDALVRCIETLERQPDLLSLHEAITT